MSGKGKAALRQKLREVRADMEALDGQLVQVERDAQALRKRLEAEARGQSGRK